MNNAQTPEAREKIRNYRLNKRHSTIVRQRIRVGEIVSRLHRHVAGKAEMTATQVQAAKLLLDKALSNAPADVNVSGEMNIHWPLAKSALDV